MNRLSTYTLLFLIMTWEIMFPSAAWAASSTTLGTMMTNVYTQMKGFPKLLSAFAYISGIYLSVIGIYKFKEHVDNPANPPLSAAVKRMVAAGCMFALPFLSNVMVGNLLGSSAKNSLDMTGSAGANGTVAGEADAMIYGFVQNIYGPMKLLLSAFCYVAAIVLLIVGISRLMKGHDAGPKGPAGLGTIMTFIVCGALFAIGDMSGVFANSLFGNSQVHTYPTITSSVLSDETDKARIASVISALLVFVNLVGAIAFIRGWFVLRQVADGGGSNVSLTQAFTFLVSGTIAMNIGEFINILQRTMGITDLGVTFTS